MDIKILTQYLEKTTDNYIIGEPLENVPVSPMVDEFFNLYGEEYIKVLIEKNIQNIHDTIKKASTESKRLFFEKDPENL